LLAAVCDLTLDEVFDSIDEATSAGIFVEDARDVARFEFAHVLVRNAIYFGTSEDERRRIHLRVAETMEANNALDPHAHAHNELAKHFAAALPDGDAAKAAFYAERAGHDAIARVAFTESARWFEYAIVYSENLDVAPAELGRLHFALATAYEGKQQSELA